MAEYIVGTDEHEGHWYTGERIVRCRDCKFGKRNGTICRHKRFAERETEFDIVYVEPDGFCSWGELKEGE